MTDWMDELDEKIQEMDNAAADDPFKNMDEEYKLPRPHLSISQVKKWNFCGEQYRRYYVEGESGPTPAVLVRGSAVHAVVEALNKYKIDNDGDMPSKTFLRDIIKAKIAEHIPEVDEWGEKVDDEEHFRESVTALSEIYYEKGLPQTRPRFVEKKIKTTIRGRIPFLGYVDLIEKSDETEHIDVEDTDEAESLRTEIIPEGDFIRDLKVTSRKKSQSDVDDSIQLTMYAMVGGVNRVGIDNLVETKSGNRSFYRLESHRTQGDIEHAADVLDDTANAIANGIFPRTNPGSWMCNPNWCEHWDKCRGQYQTNKDVDEGD